MSQPSEPSVEQRLSVHGESAWPHIRTALHDLRFGQVTLIVQDGYIVQIERTEKQRFPRAAKGAGA
ncbi:MAG: YezD family protein [Planctomycetaceae bacterium]